MAGRLREGPTCQKADAARGDVRAMEGAAAEGADPTWEVPLAAAAAAAEEAAAEAEAAVPAAEAPAAATKGGGKASGGAAGGHRPQDVTERSTPRFLRSLHQARARHCRVFAFPPLRCAHRPHFAHRRSSAAAARATAAWRRTRTTRSSWSR